MQIQLQIVLRGEIRVQDIVVGFSIESSVLPSLSPNIVLPGNKEQNFEQHNSHIVYFRYDVDHMPPFLLMRATVVGTQSVEKIVIGRGCPSRQYALSRFSTPF